MSLQQAMYRARIARPMPTINGTVEERKDARIRELQEQLSSAKAVIEWQEDKISHLKEEFEKAKTKVSELIAAARNKEHPEPLKAPKIQRVLEIVAQEFGVPVGELIGDGRQKKIITPRHVAMYMCRKMTFQSLPMIGRFFGGRDHTTVFHAITKIEDIRTADAALDQKIAAIERELNAEC